MFVSALWAQNSISDINRLKRDKDYLYGEATLDTKEAALKLAYELLEMEIKNWALSKDANISSVLASKVYDYADTIVLKRHNMIRAFAYVKKSNLKAIKGKNIKVDVNKDVPLTKPLEEIPQKAETVIETPATKVEPIEPKAQIEPLTASQAPEEKVLQELKDITSFYDLEKKMKPLKAAGEITDYGKYTTMTDPANCYLIIYDQQAVVKAILGKGVDKRKNLKTGDDDSEKNYHGCGAIWFKIKDIKNNKR
jgi:hypothetical protein